MRSYSAREKSAGRSRCLRGISAPLPDAGWRMSAFRKMLAKDSFSFHSTINGEIFLLAPYTYVYIIIYIGTVRVFVHDPGIPKIALLEVFIRNFIFDF